MRYTRGFNIGFLSRDRDYKEEKKPRKTIVKSIPKKEETEKVIGEPITNTDSAKPDFKEFKKEELKKFQKELKIVGLKFKPLDKIVKRNEEYPPDEEGKKSGIFAILGFLCFFTIVLAPIGLILSIIGTRYNRKRRHLAVHGIIGNSIWILIFLILFLISVSVSMAI